MTITSKDFKEFIALLNSNKVAYLIVGGYAVSFHGYPRYTGDLDIWVQMSIENANRLINALSDFGFGRGNFSPDDFLQPYQVLQLGYPPFRIDIITSIDGVIFEACYLNHALMKVDELQVPVIGIEDLRKNKLATGRNKDKIDWENLQP